MHYVIIIFFLQIELQFFLFLFFFDVVDFLKRITKRRKTKKIFPEIEHFGFKMNYDLKMRNSNLLLKPPNFIIW